MQVEDVCDVDYHICPFQLEESKLGRDCVLECGPDKTCFPDTCCGTKKPGSPTEGDPESPDKTTGIRQRSTGNGSSNMAAARSIEDIAPDCIVTS